MFKKTLSGLIIVMMFVMTFGTTAFALNIVSDLVTSATMTVGGVTKDNFDPQASESMSVSVVYNSATYSTLLNNSSGYVKIKKGSVTLKTVTNWVNNNSYPLSFTWEGKSIDNTTEAKAICGTAGAACPYGEDYTAEIYVESPIDATNNVFEQVNVNFKLASQSTLSITSLTATPTKGGTYFDPSPSGLNDTLTIHTLVNTPANLSLEITNYRNQVVASFTRTDVSTADFVWDGKYSLKIADPGTYTARLTASKTGYTSATMNKTFTVAYESANKPSLTDLLISPVTFNPSEEDSTITFTSAKESYITVEILNSNNEKIRGFSGYSDGNYSDGTKHEIIWNGKNDSGSLVSYGTYKLIISLRNAYGVTLWERQIITQDSGTSYPQSNDHISGISIDPSSFEPATDDEIEIEFDILKDLDELTVNAVRGTEKIELFSESDMDSESNYTITWDGTDDDDEYVAQGTWRIEIVTKIGTTQLTASKSFNVLYEKPLIKDLYISKDKIDNDLDEFTSVVFMVDEDASVDIEILVDGDTDDTFVEETEVSKDKWYAFEFDADGYDYEDNLEIKVIARNRENEDVFDSKKISFDVSEDSVSSSKANVTNDYISPVVSSGTEQLELNYYLDETADVTITIHKGTSSSGTKVIELLDIENQSSGDHTVKWNAKDDDGDKLVKGVYTYKIISNLKSTETETGKFIIGNVGDVESSSSSNTTSNDVKVSSNVVVDGESTDNDGADCGFSDIASGSQYCNASAWAKSRNIFSGYSDGTFRPYQTIKRTEMLKVILEALDVVNNETNDGSAGYSDTVSGAWYVSYLKVGKNLGVYQGDYGKTTARPDDDISRAESLKIIFVSINAMRGNLDLTCTNTAYPDVKSSDWFYNYACGAKNYNLYNMGSYENFNSGLKSTRGEVVLVLYKLNQLGLFNP